MRDHVDRSACRGLIIVKTVWLRSVLSKKGAFAFLIAALLPHLNLGLVAQTVTTNKSDILAPFERVATLSQLQPLPYAIDTRLALATLLASRHVAQRDTLCGDLAAEISSLDSVDLESAFDVRLSRLCAITDLAWTELWLKSLKPRFGADSYIDYKSRAYDALFEALPDLSLSRKMEFVHEALAGGAYQVASIPKLLKSLAEDSRPVAAEYFAEIVRAFPPTHPTRGDLEILLDCSRVMVAIDKPGVRQAVAVMITAVTQTDFDDNSPERVSAAFGEGSNRENVAGAKAIMLRQIVNIAIHADVPSDSLAPYLLATPSLGEATKLSAASQPTSEVFSVEPLVDSTSPLLKSRLNEVSAGPLDSALTLIQSIDNKDDKARLYDALLHRFQYDSAFVDSIAPDVLRTSQETTDGKSGITLVRLVVTAAARERDFITIQHALVALHAFSSGYCSPPERDPRRDERVLTCIEVYGRVASSMDKLDITMLSLDDEPEVLSRIILLRVDNDHKVSLFGL